MRLAYIRLFAWTIHSSRIESPACKYCVNVSVCSGSLSKFLIKYRQIHMKERWTRVPDKYQQYHAAGTLRVCPFSKEITIVTSQDRKIDSTSCQYAKECTIKSCPLERHILSFWSTIFFMIYMPVASPDFFKDDFQNRKRNASFGMMAQIGSRTCLRST